MPFVVPVMVACATRVNSNAVVFSSAQAVMFSRPEGKAAIWYSQFSCASVASENAPVNPATNIMLPPRMTIASERASNVASNRAGLRKVERKPRPMPGGRAEVILVKIRFGFLSDPWPRMSSGCNRAAFHAGRIPNRKVMNRAEREMVAMMSA